MVKFSSKKAEAKYWKSYNERKARKLLAFVNEIMENSVFYGNAATPLERVSFLLEHLDSDALINTLSFYFTEYPINEAGFILLLLQILSKYPYGFGTAQLINAYSKFPMIEQIAPKVSGFEITTKNGKITVYRALEMIGEKRYALKAYQTIQRKDIDLRMILLNTRFSEDTVMSCFMPRMFGGVSYEYYIKLIKEKLVLDLRHSCAYPIESFETFFQPKVLMKRKGKYLKTDIPPLFQKK